MAKILVRMCSRCGRRYDPQGEEWFRGPDGRQQHLCRDGVVADLADLPADDRPSLDDRATADPDWRLECPICCGPLWHIPHSHLPAAPGTLRVLSAGKGLPTGTHPLARDPLWNVCLRCAVGTPAKPAGTDGETWYAMDFLQCARLGYPALCESVDSAQGDRTGGPTAAQCLGLLHLVWASVWSTFIMTEQPPRFFAADADDVKRLVAGAGHISCPTCGDHRGGTAVSERRDAEATNQASHAQWPASGLRVAGRLFEGFEPVWRLRCRQCGRSDYYMDTLGERSGLPDSTFLWYYTELPEIASYPLPRRMFIGGDAFSHRNDGRDADLFVPCAALGIATWPAACEYHPGPIPELPARDSDEPAAHPPPDDSDDSTCETADELERALRSALGKPR